MTFSIELVVMEVTNIKGRALEFHLFGIPNHDPEKKSKTRKILLSYGFWTQDLRIQDLYAITEIRDFHLFPGDVIRRA